MKANGSKYGFTRPLYTILPVFHQKANKNIIFELYIIDFGVVHLP